jgi:hypothetical protein
VHVWTVEVDGVARKWSRLEFLNSLSGDPTEFTATIEYAADIVYFQYVELKNNGTVEFAGYVEDITPSWNKTGRILEIGGRHISVIAWKKFTERFSDARTEGFFGACDPAKLIGFLLRCPISDNPIGLPRHKIGWGIYPLAPSMWGFTSSYTHLTTTKNYVISRISGFAWKKGAEPFNINLVVNAFDGTSHWSEIGTGPIFLNTDDGDTNCIEGLIYYHESVDTILPVDGFDMTERDWIPEVGDYPWLDTDDGDTSYIEATVVGDNHKYFTFADKGEIGTLNTVWIDIKAKNVIFGGSGANVTIRIYLDVGAGEVNVGELTWADTENDYSVKSINVSSTVNTPTKINACKMRIEYSGGTPPDTNYSYPRITYAQLSVNEIANGDNAKWYSFADLGATYEIFSSASINIKGKNYIQAGIGASVTVRVWLDVGAGEVNVGELTWTNAETIYSVKSIDVTATLDTLTKVNACKLRLEYRSGTPPDGDYSYPRVTYAYLTVSGTKSSNQRTDDHFTIDLKETKTRLTGIIIESRKSADKYARNYAIETSANGVNWNPRATKSSNVARDIIESWAPVNTERYMRIRITANAAFDWEISQIYAYCADNRKYCVWSDGSGSVLGPYLSGAFSADNYIGTYGTITPINIPFSRMNDALNDIVQKCHDVNYDVWELWVDNYGDVHFEDRRGSDKSLTISFVKGTNLEGATKEGKTRGVVSRTRIVGKGESKKQDEISSDWQVNTTAEVALGTFFEEVESSKRVSDKDTADVIAKVKVRTEGNPEEVFTVNVSNDTYNPLAYGVGDDTTVTDSLTGMSGSYRITAIKKVITEKGEDITIYFGSKWKDFSDEWAETRRQLREIGLGNTVIEDWLGEGADQGKLSGDKVGDLWDATYKYKETPAVAEYKPAYNITGDGDPDGMFIVTMKDQFVLCGVVRTGGGSGNDIQATIDTIACNWSNNPRFVCEIEVETLGSVWEPEDNCYMRMEGVGGFTSMFGFRVRRVGGNYILTAIVNNVSVFDVDIQNLNAGQKYRLETRVDWTERIVRYYVDGVLEAILEIPINAVNEALHIMEVYFNTHFSGSGQSAIRFWSWKSQYTY